MAIERNMRDTGAAKDVERFYVGLFRPGENHLSAAADIQIAADGSSVFFTSSLFESGLEQGPSDVVCRLDLPTGRIRRLVKGRLYRPGSTGRGAYVSAGEDGAEHLVVLSEAGAWQFTQKLDFKVEDMAWSPDGDCLMVLGADMGADVSGREGGFALRSDDTGPAWLPEVACSEAQDRWRRLYAWSDRNGGLAEVTRPPVNVWEAGWLGNDRFVVVASDHHSEGSWYASDLRLLDACTGDELARHVPFDQIGVPAGTADGTRWAAIEAYCSDRGLVCGTIVLDGTCKHCALDVAGVQVSHIQWRDGRRLVYAGLRDACTVVGDIDVVTGERRELWSSDELTIGGWYPRAIPAGEGAALAVIEGYARAPAIARLSEAEPTILTDLTPTPPPAIPGKMRYHRWQGRDGLEIGGWLVLPDGPQTNLPLLVDIHGGPVWAHRNRYAASLRAGPVLVAKGYALLLPNPRGSGGHGQEFARRIHKDMGGEDTHDYLAGIDSLIDAGLVDPARVSVSGTSYGGFMTSWLITQTRRFAAAVPISPVVNWYSQHFASQIPWFDQALLDGSPRSPGGQYFDRSPVFLADRVTTPTLILGGGRDKNTPTGQARELFGALTEAGARTALAIYPDDGHSLRGYPAYLDSAARIVAWIERHSNRENGSRSPSTPVIAKTQARRRRAQDGKRPQ